MKSDTFLKLLGGLGIAFILPWVFLILIPFVSASNAEPIPYGEEEEVEGGVVVYPDKIFYKNGASDYGRQIYAAEGCAYCHTQVIRPTYAGADMWRPGWGGRDEEGLARETQPMDYTLEEVAPLGYQRIGPDLANVGHRITTKEEMHQQISDPTSIDPNSGCPPYLHLYKKSPYGKAELVPTGKAEALVDYLLSLKKDQPLPAGS
ncbi:MAG: cbb3-type cytochrome c oxidase subunit II [Verrucomicrobiota bacterium]